MYECNRVYSSPSVQGYSTVLCFYSSVIQHGTAHYFTELSKAAQEGAGQLTAQQGKQGSLGRDLRL